MKWEVEEARVIALLEEACNWHTLFNRNPNDEVTRTTAIAYNRMIVILFNVNPRTTAHILESVTADDGLRCEWGRILFDELTSSK